MHIDLCTIFWTDGIKDSTRERNAKFSVKEYFKLSEFLNTKINCNYKIYDFSPYPILENALHRPFSLSEFRKSEKLNIIIKESKADLIAIADSDTFIDDNDYENLLNMIIKYETNCTYLFDLLNLSLEDTTKIISNKKDSSFSYKSRSFEGTQCLGGFFIANRECLEQAGFNETFKVWGGEDGEIMLRLVKPYKNFKNELLNVRVIQVKKGFEYFPVKVFHLDHFYDVDNLKFYDKKQYHYNCKIK